VRVRGSEPDASPRVAGHINAGYVALVGITHTDTPTEVLWMAEKIRALRLFSDAEGRMNHDLAERQGAVLVVSQFTLYGDARKGRRPSFILAARNHIAEPLYMQLVSELRAKGLFVATGEFGADMEVELVNDGPVTMWLEREAPAAQSKPVNTPMLGDPESPALD
jgi:D-aminoacyl-tRNA deacylase